MNDKLKLLYVDDEPINLYIFEVNFRKRFNVITASSGFEGLEKLRDNPDTPIVVSDMSMPGMNGIEFISMAKNMFPGISFYILTGYDITDEIQEALTNRLINKYFRKPLNQEEILVSIDSALLNIPK
jgi:CheY-like chemotaxis protein